MLQEEGLVEIEPNQRTRVAGLDPQELDDIYASRILLETLALSMTMGNFGPAARKEAKRLLAAMRRAAKTGDFGAWFAAHADYHRLITAGAGEALQRQLQVFADRTIRYIRIYQLSDPNSWQAAGDVEHAPDPGGADRRRRARRADRDGAPPRAHGAAGADRLRAGLRAGGRAARGPAIVERQARAGLSPPGIPLVLGLSDRNGPQRRGSRRSSRSSSSARSRRGRAAASRAAGRSAAPTSPATAPPGRRGRAPSGPARDRGELGAGQRQVVHPALPRLGNIAAHESRTGGLRLAW